MFLGLFYLRLLSPEAPPLGCLRSKINGVKNLILNIVLVAGICFVLGCAKKDETYLTIQMCVSDQDGVAHLKSVMRTVAESEGLQFVDESLETGRNLNAIASNKAVKRDPALAINVGIKGKDGVFVMGGNLGLPAYQVALGFGTASDAARAHRLSDHLVRELAQEWRVETVLPGRGALPMKSCI